MSTTTLSDFLAAKGGIAFIMACPRSSVGRSYNEIEDTLFCASSTVTQRKIEAEELELIELVTESIQIEHGNTRRYKLTSLGFAIQLLVSSMDMQDRYLDYKITKNRYEDNRDEFVEWVEYVELEDMVSPVEDGNDIRNIVLNLAERSEGPTEPESIRKEPEILGTQSHMQRYNSERHAPYTLFPDGKFL